MGSWSAGVWGNDTAEDLKSEYQCAFYRYDPEEAVRRLDEYVRTSIGDESDTIEWCNYIYSLADFMWKKGILTEAVKTAAVSMIDSGFGLDEWEKSGKSALAKRRKALEELRTQLRSPLPERKPIRLKFQTERVFSDGDYIAVRLMTKDKTFCSWAALVSDITQEQFPAFDGKYIILQKVFTQTGFRSAVVPDISDNWAAFRLCDGVYDDVPSGIDTASLKSAKIISLNRISPVFLCESKMSYFRKRKAQVIGHGTPPEISEKQKKDPNFPPSIFLRFSNASWDADSLFLASMGREAELRREKPETETLFDIAFTANGYAAFDYSLSREENETLRRKEETAIRERIRNALESGAEIYTLRFGKLCGFATERNSVVENLYVLGQFQRLGLAKYLLRELRGKIPELRVMIPDVRKKDTVRHICETLDIPFTME